MRPNLFDFATSELSQDAVLAWMLSWADTANRREDTATHGLGREFLALIYKRHGQVLPDGILAVEVFTQRDRIDVVAEVGDGRVVLIEDKVGTTQHSGQLERYIETLQAGFAREQILPTYVQTFEQASFDEVEKVGYEVVTRSDLISLLDRYRSKGGDHDVAIDFLQRLESLDRRFAAYLTTPPHEWDGYAWQGFFQALQSALGRGGWGYVPNQAGGFFGFWLDGFRRDDVQGYLQLEEDKVCFKIETHEDAAHWTSQREQWHKLLIASAEDLGESLRKPRRFGHGQTMTVAVSGNPYRVCGPDGLINVEATGERVRQLEQVLTLAGQGA